MKSGYDSTAAPDHALSDDLRFQLRALRRDEPPAADLWPGIEARLQRPAPAVRVPWLALAASLLLAVGLTGLWRGDGGGQGPTAAVRGTAELTSQYRAALRRVPGAARSPTFAPALHELDRSADDIRRALARDPDSRLLIEQLRRTYARRLALSQRALYG